MKENVKKLIEISSKISVEDYLEYLDTLDIDYLEQWIRLFEYAIDKKKIAMEAK